MIKEQRRTWQIQANVVWMLLNDDPDKIIETSYARKPAKLMPDHVRVGLRRDSADDTVARSVIVSGYLLKNDGTVGSRTDSVEYRALDKMPGWLAELVRADFNAELKAEVIPQ